MTVIPFEAYSRRARKNAREFLTEYGWELSRLLYFFGGPKGVEPFQAALRTFAENETGTSELSSALDDMVLVLECACRPENKWNSVLLWFGGRLTELRYDL